MNRKKSLYIAIPFITIIFGIGIANIIVKDKETSVAENRNLKQLHDIKKENFVGEFETYYADQFILRDKFLELYTKSQILSKKTKVRDYFVYNNEWVLENPETYIEEGKIEESSNIINEYAKQLSESGKEVYYISMPHKTNVLTHMYPKYINNNISLQNKDKFLSMLDESYINTLDLSREFINKFSKDDLETLYFKTDHHWNSIGAYEGFKCIVDKINENSNEKIIIDDKDYETYTIENKSFVGSYNQNMYKIMSMDESVPYVYRKGSEEYELRKSYDGTWFAPTEISDLIARFVKEDELTYSGSYIYDDHYYQLLNPKSLTNKKALVIRDSYHSAMSWMLADIFEEVEVMDPRHIGNVNLTPKEVIQRSNADIVLFMYNDFSGINIIEELKK